jgi:hypothetical protein
MSFPGKYNLDLLNPRKYHLFYLELYVLLKIYIYKSVQADLFWDKEINWQRLITLLSSKYIIMYKNQQIPYYNSHFEIVTIILVK